MMDSKIGTYLEGYLFLNDKNTPTLERQTGCHRLITCNAQDHHTPKHIPFKAVGRYRVTKVFPCKFFFSAETVGKSLHFIHEMQDSGFEHMARMFCSPERMYKVR